MKAAAKVNLAALSAVPFVMVLSNSMLIPVLPAMQKALRVSPLETGLIITAFSIPAGLVIPVGGYLSDRFGRKPVIIPALVVFGLGGLLAGLAPLFLAEPYWAIFGGRVLQGIGGGGLYQVAMALAGDIFQTAERAKALAILEAANGVGKIVAPVIGTAVALAAWFAPYFVYPALAWAAALAVFLLVREPRKNGALGQSLGRYRESLVRTWEGKGVSLLTAFTSGMVILFLLFGLLAFYSDLLENRWGIRGFGKGWVMAIPVLVMAVTAYLTGIFLQERRGGPVKSSLIVGLAVIAAAMAGAAFLKGLYGFSAALAAMGLGSGLALPSLNQLVTGAVGASERGIVTSLYGSVRFFGAALGPPAAGRLLAAGQGVIGLGAGALAALAAVGAFLLIDRRAVAGSPATRGRGNRAPATPRAATPAAVRPPGGRRKNRI